LQRVRRTPKVADSNFQVSERVMRISAFLITATCLAVWSIPVALADSADPAAASATAEPVTPVSPTVAAAPVAPVAGHGSTDTPLAEGSAQKPADDAAAATDAKVAAAAEPDPVICRSQVETGTMGRKQKICMTKSQWDAQRDAARRFKRSVDQSRSTQPGGGG
jgi:hypothetical protein